MGCFLACFGFSKKQKRRRPSNKALSGDQRHGRYQPLDSVITKLDITENPIVSDAEFRNKGKEQSSSRIKKKVSFNLNVRTYEPIPSDYITNYFSESDEEENCAKNEEEMTKASIPLSLSEGDSMTSRMGSYPSNYRYQNLRDSYDAEDGIKLEESDMDDEENNENDEDEDDGDNDNDNDNGDDRKIEEFYEQFCSVSMESEKEVTFTQLTADKTKNLMTLRATPDQELKKLESNRNARDRSQYVYSVLNPVENLTQWKAVKARATPPLKHQTKENIALEQEQQIPLSSKSIVNLSPFNHRPDLNQSTPLMEDIAVDASLSNWLVSSGTESIAKTSSIAVAAMPSK